MKPTLNATKWQALKDIEAWNAPTFVSIEIGIHGAALHSLEKCGWIERVEAPSNLPWHVYTQGNHWRLTEEGKAVLKILPTIKPRK